MKQKIYQKKNLKLYALIIIISATGLMTSCSPEYIPNMVNTPVFSNKGEFQATVATGTSNFDAQLGYAITDNIAIIANGSFADQTNDTTDEFHKHTIIEGGVGYYKKLANSGRIEVFGGYGMGKIKTYEENDLFDDDYTDISFNRIFIQPGVGAVTDIFDGSFATRVAFVQMIPSSTSNFEESWHMFVEPVITAKIGYRYAKAVIQIGYSFPVNEESIDYNTQGLIFNFGLTINIGRDYLNL
ncbi:MAG: hypothetical protein A2X13_08085 [Bacteroidetes bacterium GWC2_33_15]|nr:MAG: hypothetical protein A2X10_05140 [Bacteroidetes bacterium GWA2_33_15]OFX52702.1 MAG: hypothetical protein A2X13_08085 [Bacteroidetes bacterium GWC2_33_15]OFX63992.1 MAG: hypothetical protein A2X15_02250 [Bacteroidetes bacterium GWB2_32_14]OFX67323.1 MAG: hypothetical protein A2X14_12165 [Bacteroidetes bacterium GWD2_33_33]HAN18810.1 hypothetical protein [Bacteroidales bacterium]